MKIVLIGCGTIGKTILEQLATEQHTITLIDTEKDKIAALIEKYDVNGVIGNGASLDIQLEAGVKQADLVIATASSDEINILASIVAKKIGCKNTIARIRNPEYYNQSSILKDELGLSMVVNPELDTAHEILNMISLPSIAKIEHFAKGKVTMLEILIDKHNPLVGETLISISKKFKTKVLICAVQRKDKVFIPTGDFVIKSGDRINITADTNSLNSFLTELNMIKTPLKNIMIVGGGKMSYYLAKELSAKKYNVKIIETNKERAEELSALLPKVTIINGDGTDYDVLEEEGIQAMDAFVSLTNVDEENIIVSMYASKVNVKKCIARVKRKGLVGIVGALEMINPVSPKHIIADKVISYIRALSNSRGNKVITLYRLVHKQIEALEFIAKNNEAVYDIPLRDLTVKPGCLIACILRNNKVIIPNGNTCIQNDDNVIVVTTHKDFNDLSEIFDR